jgi:hypothetical protein
MTNVKVVLVVTAVLILMVTFGVTWIIAPQQVNEGLGVVTPVKR